MSDSENNTKELPVATIDLAQWLDEAASEDHLNAIASKWHDAFSTHGLVYLTNHGLSKLYQEVHNHWLQFCQCEESHKDKFSSKSYGECGYNKVGKEAVALSEDNTDEAQPDPVESLENGYSDTFDGKFPRADSGYKYGNTLRDAYAELYHQLDTKVIRPCLDIASRALRLEEGHDMRSLWFEKGPGAYQLRLAHYVPHKTMTKNKLLYGEHTDYDGLTFLWRNRTNGLQAKLGDDWVDIPILDDDPDALLINLGDLMQFWTRNTWHSPLHRVVNINTDDDGDNDLVSIVMFAGM